MTNAASPWYREEYDPELHGDEKAHSADKGLAMAIVILLVALPFVLFGLLT